MSRHRGEREYLSHEMMYLHEVTKLHREETPYEVETNRLGKAAAREGRANASRASILARELKRSAGRFLKLLRALKGTLPGNGGGVRVRKKNVLRTGTTLVPAGEPVTRARRWWAMMAIALATFVTQLDNMVVQVELPLSLGGRRRAGGYG